MIEITKDNFQTLVEESDKPVLLDFWATWCGPCKMIAPLVEAVSLERPDVVVGKVNVDEQMELAIRFGIVSIPTLIVMKSGQVSATSVGYCSKDAILALLDK